MLLLLLLTRLLRPPSLWPPTLGESGQGRMRARAREKTMEKGREGKLLQAREGSRAPRRRRRRRSKQDARSVGQEVAGVQDPAGDRFI
jgi:hypothetical protein